MMKWFEKIFLNSATEQSEAGPEAERTGALCAELEELQQRLEVGKNEVDIAALYTEMTGLLKEITTAATSADLFQTYSYRVSGEGAVSFKLPQGATYLDLFIAANDYAVRHRPHAAMYETAIEWFEDKRQTAIKPLEIGAEESVQLQQDLTYQPRSAQLSVLHKLGQSFSSAEAAAAAHVLHYCATGEDLFNNLLVRAGAEDVVVGSSEGGLVVRSRIDDTGYCDVAAVGSIVS